MKPFVLFDGFPWLRASRYNYPGMKKSLHNATGASFALTVEPGGFSDSQIIVMLGENGTGGWSNVCGVWCVVCGVYHI